jgi:hypothetical protein
MSDYTFLNGLLDSWKKNDIYIEKEVQ